MQWATQFVRTVMSKRYRRWTALAILLITAFVIARFFVGNPSYFNQLKRISPLTIGLIMLLNVPAMLALAWAYDSMLKLIGASIPAKENLLLTAYSSIVNFFGPLQSGPAVRTVYLKVRHHVRVRDYFVATLVYYGLFASVNALFMLAGSRPWWQTLLGLSAVAGFSALVIWWFSKRLSSNARARFGASAFASLLAATFLQVCSICAYYFVELRAVNPHISLAQAISYTGAANFSLFVSITPDAIGFRESFLYFSQQLHHVSVANILAANVIDRISYVLFLALLFAVTLIVHARDRLHLRNVPPADEAAE